MVRRTTRRYARRRRGYRRRAFRRRVYGKRRAASQQKQRANFLIKSTYSGFIRIDPIAKYNIGNRVDLEFPNNVGGSAALSVYRNLVKSNYYNSVRTMYDQVRVNSCKITITPTQSILAAGNKQGIFISAWDRNGVDDGKRPPGFNEIASHSSAFQKPLNLEATSWKATRKIYASTIVEKSAWLPTSTLASQALQDDTGLNLNQGQNLSVPWNPQLLIGVLCSVSSVMPLNTCQSWGFLAQFEWSVTFRGLRYDVPDNDGSMQQVQAVVNPSAAPLTGDSALPTGRQLQKSIVDQLSTFIPPQGATFIEDAVFHSFEITNTAINSPFTLVNNTHTYSGGDSVLITNPNTVADQWTTFIVIAYTINNLQSQSVKRFRVVGFTLPPNGNYTLTIPKAPFLTYNTILQTTDAYETGFIFTYSVFTNPSSVYCKCEEIAIAPRVTGQLFSRSYGPCLVDLAEIEV